ncbi:hypothetical protein GGG16DRAFT_105835 [Schizophyllum commune]
MDSNFSLPSLSSHAYNYSTDSSLSGNIGPQTQDLQYTTDGPDPQYVANLEDWAQTVFQQNVRLTAENQALEANFNSLVKRIGDKLDTTNANTVTGPVHATGTVFDHPPIITLNRADFPKIPYWSKQDWANREGRKTRVSTTDKATSRKGKPKTPADSLPVPYLTHFDGSPVYGGAIRKHIAACLHQLLFWGIAPAVWGTACHNAHEYVIGVIEELFPFLRLCEGHWKLDMLISSMYSNWWSTYGPPVEGVGSTSRSTSEESAHQRGTKRAASSTAESTDTAAKRARSTSITSEGPSPPGLHTQQSTALGATELSDPTTSLTQSPGSPPRDELGTSELLPKVHGTGERNDGVLDADEEEDFELENPLTEISLERRDVERTAGLDSPITAIPPERTRSDLPPISEAVQPPRAPSFPSPSTAGSLAPNPSTSSPTRIEMAEAVGAIDDAASGRPPSATSSIPQLVADSSNGSAPSQGASASGLPPGVVDKQKKIQIQRKSTTARALCQAAFSRKYDGSSDEFKHYWSNIIVKMPAIHEFWKARSAAAQHASSSAAA